MANGVGGGAFVCGDIATFIGTGDDKVRCRPFEEELGAGLTLSFET